jgi:hypothetical protein
MWPLMMPKYYTTLRAVLLRFWAKYIFFCNKNNTLKLYVRLKGSSPGWMCLLFTLRSELSTDGTTKGPSSPSASLHKTQGKECHPLGAPLSVHTKWHQWPRRKSSLEFKNTSRLFFVVLYNGQQIHNCFTNYHTATCFDTIVSSSDSL